MNPGHDQASGRGAFAGARYGERVVRHMDHAQVVIPPAENEA